MARQNQWLVINGSKRSHLTTPTPTSKKVSRVLICRVPMKNQHSKKSSWTLFSARARSFPPSQWRSPLSRCGPSWPSAERRGAAKKREREYPKLRPRKASRESAVKLHPILTLKIAAISLMLIRTVHQMGLKRIILPNNQHQIVWPRLIKPMICRWAINMAEPAWLAAPTRLERITSLRWPNKIEPVPFQHPKGHKVIRRTDCHYRQSVFQ